MKKLTIILIIIISITQLSKAQNTFPPSGNVGIGTTNPNNLLTIGSSSTRGTLNIIGDNIGDVPVVNLTDSRAGAHAYSLYNGLSNISNLDIFDQAAQAYRLTINPSGNVGIGTTNPAYLLDANGIIHSSVTFGSNLIISKNTGASVAFDNGAGIQTSLIEAGTNDNHLEFWTNTATKSGIVERMRITNTGSLCIGATNPGNYRLAVNGGIHSQSVNVDLTGWSDYVFKQGYTLLSLAEVRSYIDQNHHLPDMPSEQDVIKDGINLGEMNKLLTKKVEELTLYLIEKDKKISSLEKTGRRSATAD